MIASQCCSAGGEPVPGDLARHCVGLFRRQKVSRVSRRINRPDLDVHVIPACQRVPGRHIHPLIQHATKTTTATPCHFVFQLPPNGSRMQRRPQAESKQYNRNRWLPGIGNRTGNTAQFSNYPPARHLGGPGIGPCRTTGKANSQSLTHSCAKHIGIRARMSECHMATWGQMAVWP